MKNGLHYYFPELRTSFIYVHLALLLFFYPFPRKCKNALFIIITVNRAVQYFSIFLDEAAKLHPVSCVFPKAKLVTVITSQAFDHNIHLVEDEESSEELCHKECRVRQSHNTNRNVITLVDRNEQC